MMTKYITFEIAESNVKKSLIDVAFHVIANKEKSKHINIRESQILIAEYFEKEGVEAFNKKKIETGCEVIKNMDHFYKFGMLYILYDLNNLTTTDARKLVIEVCKLQSTQFSKQLVQFATDSHFINKRQKYPQITKALCSLMHEKPGRPKKNK